MWKALLNRKSAPPGETARVKAAALALLPPGTQVSVSEIVCRDPGCPGTETVILVMRAGEKTRAAKITKDAADVTDADVAEALARAAG